MHKSFLTYFLAIVVLMGCLACWMGAGEVESISAADRLAQYAFWFLVC